MKISFSLENKALYVVVVSLGFSFRNVLNIPTLSKVFFTVLIHPFSNGALQEANSKSLPVCCREIRSQFFAAFFLPNISNGSLPSSRYIPLFVVCKFTPRSCLQNLRCSNSIGELFGSLSVDQKSEA